MFDPAHLVFIDETAANTKMVRLPDAYCVAVEDHRWSGNFRGPRGNPIRAGQRWHKGRTIASLDFHGKGFP
jgi:hypothetical protein